MSATDVIHNLTRMAVALEPFQLRLRGLPEGVPNAFDRRSLEFGTNYTLVLQDGEEFDLLGEMSAIGGYDAIVGRAIEMDVAGHTVKVLALEDLIRTKRAAARPKDLAALPVLEATLQMLQEKSGA
jgi:predicted nucleotidyltransferase